jgi:hypothetical protein
MEPNASHPTMLTSRNPHDSNPLQISLIQNTMSMLMRSSILTDLSIPTTQPHELTPRQTPRPDTFFSSFLTVRLRVTLSTQSESAAFRRISLISSSGDLCGP